MPCCGQQFFYSSSEIRSDDDLEQVEYSASFDYIIVLCVTIITT